MSKQVPALLSGHCPYLNGRHSIIVVYLETRPPGSHVPHYKVADMECDYSEKCGYGNENISAENTTFCCPIALNAPKHPPGAGLG